jgi:hypothetical protein
MHCVSHQLNKIISQFDQKSLDKKLIFITYLHNIIDFIT